MLHFVPSRFARIEQISFLPRAGPPLRVLCSPIADLGILRDRALYLSICDSRFASFHSPLQTLFAFYFYLSPDFSSLFSLNRGNPIFFYLLSFLSGFVFFGRIFTDCRLISQSFLLRSSNFLILAFLQESHDTVSFYLPLI